MKVLVGLVCYCVWLFVVISCTLSLKSHIFVTAAPPHDVAASSTSSSNRRTLPPLKHYDIWSAVNGDDEKLKADDLGVDDDDDLSKFTLKSDDLKIISNSFGGVDNWRQNILSDSMKRQSKVPVDGECLSNDGRRTGTCFNAYECRMKGGTAKGECAMGFGVCCIFIASCNEIITNNITYLVSPNFPSFMPDNFTSCRLKVKLLNADISQLRIDFFHFSLGQPNRRTGVCDGDVFNVTGGPGGTISLCGQNSGQHMYYDVDSRALARQQVYGSLKPLTYDQLYPTRNDSSKEIVKEIIEISLNFTQRYQPSRLWEIRIAQIPFSQRAPAGCLQYFTGTEGIIQTFNYADNGRHLANQHYRICMRQETEMCSIVYRPCDDQSFRIGPNEPFRTISEGDYTAENSSTTIPMETPIISSPSTTTTPVTTTTTTSTTSTTTSTTTTTTTAPETTTVAENSTEEDITTTVTSELSDDVEGSGEDWFTPSSLLVSRRPRPVSGGFDLLGFLRHALDLRRFARTLPQSTPNESQQQQKQQQQQQQRQMRQFIRKCTDRITLPCIIEDFIDAGFGPLPGCEPVHCGSQFCASGMNPCRIESTVTPFYIGVNFGDGMAKGSAEDNIGACLRYTQVQCM